MTVRRTNASRFTSRLCSGASVIAVAGALALGSSPAAAQDTAQNTASTGGIETVVVTAQFTEQNLQATPLSVSAVTAQDLQQRGISDLSQLARQVPSLTLNKTPAAFGSGVQVYIRGVGQYDTAFASEPGVGMYIDDVYYGTLFGSSLELYDLSRVEVLRGPQGVLGGKNNIGGAIRLFSQKPQGGNTGYVELSYGSRNELNVRGTADLTVIPEKVFLRVSAVSRDQDGYVNVVDYACNHGGDFGPDGAGSLPVVTTHRGCNIGTQGGTNVRGVRAAARFVLPWHMEDTVSVDVLRDDSETQAGTLFVVDDNDPSGNVFINRGGHPVPVNRALFYGIDSDHASLPQCQGSNPDPFFCSRVSAAGITTWNNAINIPTYGIPWDTRFMADPFKTTYATYRNSRGAQYDDGAMVHAWGANNVFDWDLTDNIHFKNITGWRYYEAHNSNDSDVSPLFYQLTTSFPQNREFQEEGRFTGSLLDNDALQWAVGAFYYHRVNQEFGPVEIEGALAPFLVFEQSDRYETTSKSVYGNFTWNVWGDVDVYGGVRYTKEEKTFFFDHSQPVPGFPNPPYGGFFRDTVDPTLSCNIFIGLSCDHSIHPALHPNVATTSRPDWRGGVDWRFNEDNAMVYFTYSTGYRSGGFNSRPFDPLQLGSYGPETLKAYEVGLKADWWDHRLRTNLSVYQSNYDNTITPLAQTDAFGLPWVHYVNLGSSKLRGFEAEVSLTPIEGLLLNATYSLIDPDVSSIPGAPAGYLDGCTPAAFTAGICPQVAPGTVRTGSHPILYPERQFHIDAQYAIQTADWGVVTPFIVYNWQSTVYQDANNNPYTAIDAHGIWDARLTWDAPQGGWQASVLVNNLADKHYFVNMFNLAVFGQGSVEAQPATGREWLIQIRKSF